MITFHIDSEVGVLRRVLLHRPGLELRRLTPSNCSDLLFDDVLWVKRARQEHDAFADTLTDRGIEVLYVAELLAETVKDDAARAWLLNRVITERDLGRDLAGPVRSFFDGADPTTVATHPIGGITPAELPAGIAHGLRTAVNANHGFVLPPLPNHMFTRDTTCWIYGGVSVNPMAMPARRRETAHLEAIYRFHPLFSGEPFLRWYGGVDEDHGSATIEGGDVLVIGNGAVLIGMGERTTPQAVEALARNLFMTGAATTVIPVALPSRRAFMHLDPSPEPKSVVELHTIRTLVHHRINVTCAGGGGIPVVPDGMGGLRGVEAVIDKDLSAALLAKQLGADALVLLTDVDAVYVGWGTPDQRAIRETRPALLRPIELPAGSMGPKVDAACRFVEGGGRFAAIGALGDAAAILRGEAGTIVRDGDY